ncbi:MAG: alginate lyase family protein [Urechidicola sp.]|nr:alginate lyase family protein [Urechidicola sp.]
MNFRELFFFRIPQQFQYNFFGFFQKNKQIYSKTVSINSVFIGPKYSLSKLKSLIKESENIFEFSYYQTKFYLSQKADWLKDYKNDITSSQKYYGKINRQNFEEFGDVKYVCEPSRFYFLPFLALYHVAYDDERSIAVIETILKDWTTQNPYLKTIHWTSGIEVGIRSVNLIYTHLVLSQQNKLTKNIDDSIKKLIQYNYQFLKNHLSLYSSANNHLVAELTGLVAITSYFNNKKYLNSREKWREKLYKEIENQVNDDGVNMELSTHYHAEVTDHFLNALQFIKRCGNKIPERIENRFKKMFTFLNHVEYTGNKTIFGDNDEGYLLFPCFTENFSIYKSLLKSSDISYNTNFLNSESTDLRNYLMFGENHELKQKGKESTVIKDEIFPSSGYAFFYNENKSTKLSIDFGTIGDNLLTAHGHSDIFHFTLEVKGIPILIDSGTFQYHTKYHKWREYFKSVKAHNTISINGLNQATSNSRMSWSNLPNVKFLDSGMTSETCHIVAKHNSYRKLGYTHERSFVFNKKENKIVIRDILKPIKNNNEDVTLEYYLNFNPTLRITHNNDSLNINERNVKIRIENSFFKGGELIEGDESKMLGWYSKSYDKIQKGAMFMFTIKINKEISFITEINIDA